MAIGFVLITTIPGEEERVRNALDSIEHVTDRWMLFGEFDLLAHVSSDSAKNLTSLLMKEFRTIEGIRDTQTLIAVEY